MANNVFVAWIELSWAFNSKMFWESISCFFSDEKLTQSVIQTKMWYQVSEEFLDMHFAVDQFQDMIWKIEEPQVSKNIELKIWL